MTPLTRPRWLLLGAVLAFALPYAAARGPQAPVSIPLEPLGYEPVPEQLLLSGGSMLTVDFVDEHHLLVTFYLKQVLKRLPDCLPEDQDRVIEAWLLELPSGKPLAHTSWRVHDHGRYLWSLGGGRFLLRVRNTLATIAPLANLGSGDAFSEWPLLETSTRQIDSIQLSPDGEMMMVESSAKKPVSITGAESHHDPAALTQVDLFHIVIPDGSGDAIEASHVGRVSIKGIGDIPMDSAGIISAAKDGLLWQFNFKGFDGTATALAPFNSSCHPRPYLVSRSEFVAFGCHATKDIQVIGGFNLRGEEMWEQTFASSLLTPRFAFAPAAGRFALSHMISSLSGEDVSKYAPELIDRQTIVVYQTDSGRQILHLDCTPIDVAGQNFALSSDGLSLAVFHNEAIEVYSLPSLTAEEKKAVQLAKESEPEVTAGELRFAQPAAEPRASQPVDAEKAANVSVPASGSRKPPTWFTLPEDKSDAQESPK
ncbi:MAG: hypothetical protein FWD64_04465 [Acidobacteriaceae bacterium]|nr:hypothetical protein [Acidobacteriaceae bacterium]